jgi:NhaP-type Na+/H+ or K+/H+ antiporter
MVKLKENEVQVGQTKIGPETVIQMNLKTLVIILTFVLSGLTTAWVTLSMKISDSSKKNSESIDALSKDIKSMKEEDLKELSRKVYEIDGKVQVIFIDMQNGNRDRNSNSTNQPVNNIQPQMPH